MIGECKIIDVLSPPRIHTHPYRTVELKAKLRYRRVLSLKLKETCYVVYDFNFKSGSVALIGSKRKAESLRDSFLFHRVRVLYLCLFHSRLWAQTTSNYIFAGLKNSVIGGHLFVDDAAAPRGLFKRIQLSVFAIHYVFFTFDCHLGLRIAFVRCVKFKEAPWMD